MSSRTTQATAVATVLVVGVVALLFLGQRTSWEQQPIEPGDEVVQPVPRAQAGDPDEEPRSMDGAEPGTESPEDTVEDKSIANLREILERTDLTEAERKEVERLIELRLRNLENRSRVPMP